MCLLSIESFRNTRIGDYFSDILRIFPGFSWDMFSHMTRLDQSRASENIWWIIVGDTPILWCLHFCVVGM